MRIVVISDSHKNTRVIDKILSAQSEAQHVFFLGDNAVDIEDFEYLYREKSFYCVCGNCDYFSLLPTVGTKTLGGAKILYTHGHTFNVKYGTRRLLETARNNGYNIVLYGHTHISQILYDDGVYIVNPGSCSQPRDTYASYAVIDITEKGIMPIIVRL